jgi:hypothetical protein
MHIEAVPNRNSPPAILLRETWREDGKIKKRTIANLTHGPAKKIEALRRAPLVAANCRAALPTFRLLRRRQDFRGSAYSFRPTPFASTGAS